MRGISVGFLVHVILGIRPPADSLRRGSDSQGRMDLTLMIMVMDEERVGVDGPGEAILSTTSSFDETEPIIWPC